MFEETYISFIWYIIIVVVSVIVLFMFLLYNLYSWHSGRSLKMFLIGKVNSWMNTGYSLFERITIDNSITFEEATKDKSSGYIRTFDKSKVIKNPKKSFLSSIIKKKDKDVKNDNIIQTNSRVQIPVIPHSSYGVNGVDTVLVWDLHPTLPEYIRIGLEKLIEKNIKTLNELKEYVDGNPDGILYDKYTYKDFLSLYLSYKEKYDINVKVSDVLSFISKNSDKNFRESLQVKDINSSYKKKSDDKYTKYGYAAVLIIVIAIAFKIVYVTYMNVRT